MKTLTYRTGASRRAMALFLILALFASSLGTFAVAAEQPSTALTDITTQTDAADDAVAWLLTQIQPDGSFDASAGTTCDAVLAGVAALKDVSTWNDGAGGASPIEYLSLSASEYITSSEGAAGKLAVTVVAADLDPASFGGLDLGAMIDSNYDPTSGVFGADPGSQAWNMLGLAAMRRPVEALAVQALTMTQDVDGGWGWPGYGSDADTTATCIEALVAADVALDDPAISEGLAYLAATQTTTGGWGRVTDSPSSTAFALQALLVTGEDPTSGGPYEVLCHTPLSALLALQMPSGGFPGWTGAEDVMSTAQAVPGLVGRPLPIPGVVPALTEAVEWLKLQQEDDGSYGANTAGVIMAAAAVGEAPRAWKSADGTNLIQALEDGEADLDIVGRQGRAATALAMAGENPYLCGDTNLISAVNDSYDVMSGSYDAVNQNIGHHVLAMWAMLAAETPGTDAAQWLIDQQNADGGWGWAAGQDSDSNSTAIAIEALIAAGSTELDQEILDALLYLKTAQANDGGFVWSPVYGGPSDADSTAVSLQAMYACGVTPHHGWDYAVVGESGAESIMIKDPETRLLELQLSSGAFVWMPGTGANVLATLEAIPALGRVAFPVVDDVLRDTQTDVDWLETQQLNDGSWSDDAGRTVDVILAGVAAGRDAGYWKGAIDGSTAIEYLEFGAATYATSAANAGKLAVGAVAAGADPFAFGGLDLAETILALHDGEGSLGNNTADSYWGILGLDAMGAEIPAVVVDVLKAEQASDGGWGWQFGQDSDADTTAYVLQALMAAGVPATDPVVVDGLAYLKMRQVAGGGFESGPGYGANPNSTAGAIQAIVACGKSPKSAPWGSVDGDNPVDALFVMRLAGDAYPGWSGGADVLSTAQAVCGVLVETLPLRNVEHQVFLPLVLTASAD